MKNPTSKLMIPGPVQPDQDVLDAMAKPVMPHFGPEWTELYKSTADMLKPVFGTAGDVFILNGAGSTGLDACIGSAFASGETIVVGMNGFFGERLVSIAQGYNIEVLPVQSKLGEPLDPKDFLSVLQRNPKISGIAAVHLETSTTIINPIQEIAQLARRFGIPLIVDAVTSLGGIPFDMDQWGIDFCASASQKCLGAPPGLTPVAVGPNGWEKIDRIPNKGHGWYTNLRIWRQFAVEWGDWSPHPVTIATNNLVALRTSLDSLLREGIGNRMQRFRNLALQLRSGLRALGMPPFTPDEMMAPIVTAAHCPVGVSSSELVKYLLDVHRIQIAGGLGSGLKEKIFRIGHMSPALNSDDIEEVLHALAQFSARPDARNNTA